jgi:hypothetical protein
VVAEKVRMRDTTVLPVVARLFLTIRIPNRVSVRGLGLGLVSVSVVRHPKSVKNANEQNERLVTKMKWFGVLLSLRFRHQHPHQHPHQHQHQHQPIARRRARVVRSVVLPLVRLMAVVLVRLSSSV